MILALHPGKNLGRRIQLAKTRIICVKAFSNIVPFKLADIGEGIAEVELMKWFVRKGDSVKAFDRLCEVQSDKATVEITSRYNGVIAQVYHEEGSIVKVGESLVDIEIERTISATSKPPPGSIVDFKTEINHAPSSSSAKLFSGKALDSENEKIQTTPAVRKIAKENGINLALIRGSGPKGRILKEDLLGIVAGSRGNVPLGQVHASPFPTKSSPSPQTQVTHSTAATDSNSSNSFDKPSFSHQGDRKVPVRGVQRLMVKTMTAANKVPHLTLGEEVNFTKMIDVRKDLKKSFDALGVKLSFLPFILKATSLALLEFPSLNSTVDDDVTEVTHHHAHNIGIAIDTSKGLIVPVIKNIQSKSIFDIALEITQLQEAAVNGTIKEHQLQGGTFSISNIGSIGGTYAAPVLVVPQVVIGAIGRLQVVPRYFNSNNEAASSRDLESGDVIVKPASIVNISWSADHRVVDGATVARFSNKWRSYIESPTLMLGFLK